MAQDEFAEHTALCQYLRVQYPDVIFFSDLSGVRVSAGVAGKIKSLKCARGIPDLIILEPRGEYSALCLELKATGVKVFKKKGGLLSDPHLEEQYAMLERLTLKGYFAGFAEGFERAKSIIDWYMTLPPQ